HRVLFYGIFGALVLRGAFVVAGAQLLARFEWIVYFFGVLLLYSGVRMLRGVPAPDRESNPVLRLLRRRVPTTNGLAGQHLFVRAREIPEDDWPRQAPMRGGWYATPLLAVLVVIETSDVIFAVDSIPAIFAVTRDPFLVYSSNVFAILGLRALFFVLAGMMDKFVYLKPGVAMILIFVGIKMTLSYWIHVPILVSLSVIVATLAAAVALSLRRSAQEARMAA
ncbi:MAG: TerC/Alx family metal homeostasis membrane protein, partial [Pseudonocardiaceae bacterium]